MKAWKHFCTINHHKHLVMKGCFAVGLYKQGLLHDLSKYTPTEFLVGCKYYQGTMSPNNAERKDKGYSSAWLHHKGRNKHHMEYWIDYGVPDEGGGQGTLRHENASAVRGGDVYRPCSGLEKLPEGALYRPERIRVLPAWKGFSCHAQGYAGAS